MLGYTWIQWLFFFFFYSFFGWCFESTYVSLHEKRFVNRGFIRGSFLPLYGTGALMMLIVSMPFRDNLILTYVAGCVGATVLEYITGVLMETLFKVRYWDYSKRPLNLHGYICALSAATWAVFSVLIVSVVNPLVKPFVYKIPLGMADVASVVLVCFAVLDTVFAVRRALDLRALLESMERYAKELQALHGGLDSISDRVSGMIRDFAAHVDSRQEELTASVGKITAARDHVREMMAEKRMSLEDGAKERFANFEKILADAASYLPDVSALKNEIAEAKAKYDRQSEALRQARERRLLRAEHALRNNPSAASSHYRLTFEQLKRMQKHDEQQKKDKKKTA